MKKSKYGLVFVLVLVLVVAGISFKTYFSQHGNLVENKAALAKSGKVEPEITYEINNLKAVTISNNYTSPTFSPDGKKLTITNLNFTGINLINPEDGTLKVLTDDEGAGFRYSWSPDGKKIVYLSRRIEGGKSVNTVKLAETETGKIIPLTAGGIGASMPAFTPANEIIYSFKGTLIKRKKESIDVEEVVAEKVPANIIIPTTTGDWLIVEDDEGIKIMDNHAKNRKTIVKNGPKDFACNSKISSDGRKVMYSNNIETIDHLFVYDTVSENTVDLGEGFWGQWMPDNRIIYCIPQNSGNRIIASELFVINPDGTGKTKITDTPDIIEIQPALSPNGKSIAFRDEKSGKIFIGELNVKIKNE